MKSGPYWDHILFSFLGQDLFSFFKIKRYHFFLIRMSLIHISKESKPSKTFICYLSMPKMLQIYWNSSYCLVHTSDPWKKSIFCFFLLALFAWSRSWILENYVELKEKRKPTISRKEKLGDWHRWSRWCGGGSELWGATPTSPWVRLCRRYLGRRGKKRRG